MTSIPNIVGLVGGIIGFISGILRIWEFIESHKIKFEFILLNSICKQNSIYDNIEPRTDILIDCLLINKSNRQFSITDVKLFLYSKDGKKCNEKIVETKHKTHDKIPYVIPPRTNERIVFEFSTNEKPDRFEKFGFDGKIDKGEKGDMPLHGTLVLNIESSKPHIEHIPINKKGRIPGSIDSLQLSQLKQMLCGELNEK